MWPVHRSPHDPCMRSNSLPKSLLVAVLGCIVLSGCGARSANTDQALAGSSVSVASVQEAPAGEGDPELRFLEMLTRTMSGCEQHVPSDKGVPPEDLPGGEGGSEPTYGPGETPPGVPNADGELSLTLPEGSAPPKPAPDSTRPSPKEELPLTAGEECVGGEHAKRIGEAFKNTKTADHAAMQKKLTDLDYTAAHVHRMPDHAGAPRVRIDLRMMGSRLALEVTGTSSGVTVEAFGAFEGEDVNVAEVKRKPKP